MKYKQHLSILLILTITLSLCGCLSEELPNYPPHINLKIHPTTATAPATITLEADIFNDETDPLNISWDLGDGSKLYGTQKLTHTYQLPGTYTITLTVTDNEDTTTQTNTTLIINENIPPSVQISSNTTIARPNQPIEFSVFAKDYDGIIQNNYWDFSDNTTSTDQRTNHAFTQIGTYIVTYTATDDQGKTTTQNITILIQDNQPPKINNITSDKDSILIGPARAQFNASCIDSDGIIVSYEWDFDESFPYSLYKQETTGQNISHLFLQAKTYHITLTVTDNEGATDTYYKPFMVQYTPLSLFTSIQNLYNFISRFLPLPSIPTN